MGYGYTRRFGLVYVDFDARPAAQDSARYYASVVRKHRHI